MLKVAVVGVGNIGNIHAPNYKSDPLSELVAVCDIIPERADKAAAKYGVRAYLQRGGSAAPRAAGCGEYLHRRRRKRRRPFHPHDAVSRGRAARPGREADLKRHRQGTPDGGKGRRERRLLRHQPQPPLCAPGGHRQAVGDGRAAGRPAAHQHDDVDQQSQRDVAVVPPARPASPLARHHALLLRRRGTGARLSQPGAGPRLLLERPDQPALCQRRGGPPDRQLRHRSTPQPRTLRGAGDQGPLRPGQPLRRS